MAMYENRKPEERPLHEAVSDLTAAVWTLVLEIRKDRRRRALARLPDDTPPPRPRTS